MLSLPDFDGQGDDNGRGDDYLTHDPDHYDPDISDPYDLPDRPDDDPEWDAFAAEFHALSLLERGLAL